MQKKFTWAAVCFAATVFCLLAALVPERDSAVAAAGSAEVSAVEDTEPKYIALTFDDGPRADTTAVLLDGLDQRGVKATFFLIGEQIEGNEWLVRWMAESGHQIGNHTFNHTKLQGSGKDVIVTEINKTEVVLNQILGEGEYWLRPPYGIISRDRKSTRLNSSHL